MNARRSTFVVALTAALAILLAACSADGPEQSSPSEPAPEQAQPPAAAGEEDALALVDEQGAVSVHIVPLNLSGPGETLDFRVTLDTHSVDLGMDLALLTTLSNDLELTVEGSLWNAPRGGHHVEGILSFPAGPGGQDLLSGASLLTLTLRGLDVPERTFQWTLPAE